MGKIYIITLSAGIGNIIQAAPLMNFLRARGDYVAAKVHKRAYSREAVDLVRPSFDRLWTEEFGVPDGAVDKGNLAKDPFFINARTNPEWKVWFMWHDIEPPAPEDVVYKVQTEDTVEPGNGIVLAPTAAENWFMKIYPHWQGLIDIFSGCAVIGLSRKDGGNLIGNFVDYRGRCTLKQTAGLLKKADFVISHECGMAHLAAAAGTHVFVLCGGTSQVKNLPAKNVTPVVSERVFECQPCQFRSWYTQPWKYYGCRPEQMIDGHVRCLHHLTPEWVRHQIGLAGCLKEKDNAVRNG